MLSIFPLSEPYDIVMASLCLLREAEGESVTVKHAVFNVIKNRVQDTSSRWPNCVADVVMQPFQFSSFNPGNPRAYLFPSKFSSPQTLKAWFDCIWVVTDSLQIGDDPTQGATFYHDVSIHPPAVAWLGAGRTVDDLMKFHTVDLGHLRFYKIP